MKENFKKGDKVKFSHKGKVHIGTIIRVNQKSCTIDLPMSKARVWHIGMNSAERRLWNDFEKKFKELTWENERLKKKIINLGFYVEKLREENERVRKSNFAYEELKKKLEAEE